MYYKKEKQFIRFGVDESKVYTFDCDNQTFLGLRGTILKTPPAYFRNNDFFENKLMRTLKSFLNFIDDIDTKLNFNKIESIVEASDVYIYFSQWDSNKEAIIEFLKLPTKEIVYAINKFKEKNNFTHIDLSNNSVCQLQLLLMAKKINIPPTITSPAIVRGIIKNKDLTYYMYELQALADMGNYIDSYINKFLDWCKDLNRPLKEKGKSFCEQYVAVQKEYKAKENEILQNKLKDYNSKLKFENNDYIVIIPNTVEQYKEEATNQHNCVFSCYMERVANKTTNVVFIRKKEEINNSYITCEIDNNYNIKQYLTKYNNCVQDESALNFKYQYQNYLNTLKEL